MKKSRRKCQPKLSSKKNLTHALRVPLVTFTPDEVDLLLSVVGLLAQVGEDPRSGATMPLLNQIGRTTSETRQKLLAIRDHLGKKVIFDHTDYVILYTATMLFGQVKLLMPVLLPASLASPHVEARVQALEKMIASTLPSFRVDEERSE